MVVGVEEDEAWIAAGSSLDCRQMGHDTSGSCPRLEVVPLPVASVCAQSKMQSRQKTC